MTALILTMVLGMQQAAKTPEEAFRAFIVATATKNEADLKAVTLPNDDFALLLKGPQLPKDRVAEMRAAVDKMTISSLKAGDTFKTPQGQLVKVGADEVGEDRAVLLPEGAPLPTRCRKIAGAWKVDATPIIAGRKAADDAKKAQEGKKSGALKKG